MKSKIMRYETRLNQYLVSLYIKWSVLNDQYNDTKFMEQHKISKLEFLKQNKRKKCNSDTFIEYETY
jgi:hypothetical protein